MSDRYSKITLIIFFNLFVVICLSQPVTLPVHNDFGMQAGRHFSSLSDSGFSGSRPFVHNWHLNKDSLQNEVQRKLKQKQPLKLLGRKLKSESLLRVDSADFYLALDPLFNFEGGVDQERPGNNYYLNSRGVMVRGTVGRTFYFESSFYENQAVVPAFLDSFVTATGVMPQQGRVKAFKQNGYDFAYAQGHFNWMPLKRFYLQCGHGKLFYGHGYRSLLLSDNAFNYPYLKASVRGKKWEYQAVWASLMAMNAGRYTFNPLSEPIYLKKNASFQYLTLVPFSRLEFSFFQGIIWQTQSAFRKAIDFSFFNPVIFSHALQYNLSDKNNVLAGINFRFKIIRGLHLYGQYMLDDLAKTGYPIKGKNGMQAGVSCFDPGGIRNLFLQAEFNTVSPFSYAQIDSRQSYTHYNQPLAHPMGANFSEWLVRTSYRWHDFFTDMKIILANRYQDSGTTFLGGSNPLQSIINPSLFPGGTYAALTGDGFKNPISVIDFRVGYVINRITNLCLTAGVMQRNEQFIHGNLRTTYLYGGIGTQLFNKYYDF